MRNLLFALAVAGAGLAIQPAPASAQVSNYPFCLQGRDTTGGQGDCSYPTYQACLATASGTFAWCYQNPYYQPGPSSRRSSY